MGAQLMASHQGLLPPARSSGCPQLASARRPASCAIGKLERMSLKQGCGGCGHINNGDIGKRSFNTGTLTSSACCSMTAATVEAAELKLERRNAAGSRSSATESTLQSAAVVYKSRSHLVNYRN